MLVIFVIVLTERPIKAAYGSEAGRVNLAHSLRPTVCPGSRGERQLVTLYLLSKSGERDTYTRRISL